MNIEEEVKQKLIEKYEYDFDSEWWTDVEITMMQEIIETTQYVVNKLPIHVVGCCVCETPKPEKIHGIITACIGCRKPI